MIERASFSCFKSLREVGISFDRLTVFVGPNASGKTSILQGLEIVSRATQSPEKLESEVFVGDWGIDSLWNRSATGLMELCREDTSAFVKLSAARAQTPAPTSAEGQGRREGSEPWTYSLKYRPRKPEAAAWQVLKKNGPINLLTSTRLLKFDTSILAKASYSSDPVPRMAADGYGLASMLAFTRLNRPDVFSRIEESLHEVVPSVARIRFDRVPVSPTSPSAGPFRTEPRLCDRLLFDMKQTSGVPANHISEGTLMALGIIAVLMESDEPVSILLDDIDHAMHPRAQRDLVGVIRRILNLLPNVQIVATTHSPYFVDNLDPHEIRLTSLREDGTTACARLDEHPDFEKWKDEMAPGEFWSTVGEKWVAEREAAGATP